MHGWFLDDNQLKVLFFFCMDYLCFCLFYFSFVCWSILVLFLLLCSVRRATLITLGTKKTKILYCMPENMKFSDSLAKNTLRSLVGSMGWNYCVIWKLSEDQRFIELMDCCCVGTDQSIEDGEVDNFQLLSPILPCRDVMFQHPRTKSCELLAQLPSSMALDSGIHAQSLISNQPKWLNFSASSESNLLEETIGTRVLIPIHGRGLIELFVTEQLPEDQRVIDFITTQCNHISLEDQQEAILNNSSNNMDTCFSATNNANHNHPMIMNNDQLQSLSNGDLPYDITVDRIRLCSPPMNFLHQFNYSPESKTNNNGDHIFFEGSHDQMQYVDATKEANDNDSSIKDETTTRQQQSDSVSDSYCSDQNDDEDDNSKFRRRSGKGKSKNLLAERRRRKKLNDRLYALRSLVPNISKLDRASILGDAIEFVKELNKQAKELQDELEDHDHSDDDDHNSVMPDILSEMGGPSAGTSIKSRHDHHHNKSPNGFYGSASISKQNNNQDFESTADKSQQMEVQVEVSQIVGNEFFVKVFCEHKLGGFVKLMEALHSLGLEVTNANMTSCRGLVSNVFHVEKKDSEIVQADNLRESLMVLTRNPLREGLWQSEIMTAKEVAESSNVDHHQHQHQHYYHIHS